MKRWQEDDEKFIRNVTKGHAFQAIPRDYLRALGFSVYEKPLTIRNHIKDAKKWKDSKDLLVSDEIRLEVKSRNISFTSPEDWPFYLLPAFIEPVREYDAKKVKPFAFIFVSQITRAMVATCGLLCASKRWGKMTKFDPTRGFPNENYTVEQQHIRTMGDFVPALRQEVERVERGRSGEVERAFRARSD